MLLAVLVMRGAGKAMKGGVEHMLHVKLCARFPRGGGMGPFGIEGQEGCIGRVGGFDEGFEVSGHDSRIFLRVALLGGLAEVYLDGVLRAQQAEVDRGSRGHGLKRGYGGAGLGIFPEKEDVGAEALTRGRGADRVRDELALARDLGFLETYGGCFFGHKYEVIHFFSFFSTTLVDNPSHPFAIEL